MLYSLTFPGTLVQWGSYTCSNIYIRFDVLAYACTSSIYLRYRKIIIVHLKTVYCPPNHEDQAMVTRSLCKLVNTFKTQKGRMAQ